MTMAISVTRNENYFEVIAVSAVFLMFFFSREGVGLRVNL